MKDVDEFSRLHPVVNIVFYVTVLVISMFQMEIGLLVISLVSSITYFLLLKGRAGIKYIGLMAVVFVVSGIVNPLFSHRGATLLFYLPTGNPVTLESIIYGIMAATIIVEVLIWFGSFNMVVTFDKVLASIGKFAPHISTLLVIVFRFVPRFIHQYKITYNANKALVGDKKGIKHKVKNALNVFSIVITWALENSVDTADSIRARGYGTGKRTSYDNYKITKRDTIVLIIMLLEFFAVLIGLINRKLYTEFYPYIEWKENIEVYIIFGALCITPVIIDGLEEIRWLKLKSKI